MSKESAPLDYFLHAYGPAAQPTMVLNWVFTAIALGVCLIIITMLASAILRRRPVGREVTRREPDEGMRFITICTGVTIAVLLGMAVYMLLTLNTVSHPPEEAALTIKVTAYDWWWKVEYNGFETANEIHIPVGVPVLVKLESADVIHAFWVPQLAGKTQTIPGLTNRQWIEADEPGVYRGQCTQFCGLQHAHMAFEVIAESPEEFKVWKDAQKKTATDVPSPVFMENCASCHAVRGTGTAGGHAPDLTHFALRRMIGAGMLANTPEHVMEWVAHVQDIKPGARMPNFALSPRDAAALSAYLSTLK